VKPKPFNARAAEKKLDRLWSEAIKARDGYRCRRCGRTTNLQSAHIHSRSRKSTRHDLDNGLTLCGGRCHLFFAHKDPLQFAEFVKQELGEEKYTLLMVKASKPRSPLNPFTAKLLESELKVAIERYKLVEKL
jgi:5-methylcytosine-specific restriction endonuclease McrA